MVGKTLIGVGVVLLLFVAYQIWGTSIQESRSQSDLRTTLAHETTDTQVQRALAEATALDKLPKGPPVVAATTAAPAEGTPVGTIRIPAIGLNQVVVEGTQTQDLRKGPGHYIGTPLPGQAGNAGIAGHRTTYGHPFYNLNNLKVGDPIVLTTLQGIFVYDTLGSRVVAPSDATVLKNAPGDDLTLTTCNPRFSASSRLVVTARLTHSQLFPNAGLPPITSGVGGRLQSNDLAGSSNGQLLSAVGWGVLVIVAGGGVLLLAHFYRRRRWVTYAGGSVGLLVLLYFFFSAITPLLPASF